MALTKATFSMIQGAVFNVKDYGAVGNDSADDTSAIQAALDAAEASTYGGIVYIPAGIYKTTSALTVSDRKVSIRGDGAESSVISAFDCNGLTFTSSSYDRGTSFYEDFSLVGRTGSSGSYVGITSGLPSGGVSGTDSRDGLHFNRLKLFEWDIAFSISHTWEWTIKNCKFQKINQALSLGDYAMVGRFIDNYCVHESGDSYSGTANPYAIDFTASVKEGININGNQLFGFERAINIPLATHIQISHNDIAATEYGIKIDTVNGACNIENNYFDMSANDAVGIYASPLATDTNSLYIARGNHFVGTTGTGMIGIQLNTAVAQYQWHWRIINNNFFGLTSYDILSYNSGDVVVDGNRCQSTGTTHSISVTDAFSTAPAYITNNFCKNTINTTAADVANGDVILENNYANSAKQYGNAFVNQIAITDGITAPSTLSGFAQLYVDTSDGDLKVKFGDGTVKTIVVDS